MGFNQVDARSMQEAKKYFRFGGYDSNNKDNPHVVRIDVDSTVSIPTSVDIKTILSDLIKASEGFYNYGPGTTVWLYVIGSIPQYLIDAIESLNRYGVAIVVTDNNNNCSLDASNPFSTRLNNAIKNAARDGMIWHPIMNAMVSI